MPKVDAEKVESGPGWGCSCRAFRLSDPTPHAALSALDRAGIVTVEFVREKQGRIYFSCWTDPGSRYNVVYDPHSPGGWCKHCIAAHLMYFGGNWTRALLDDARDVRQRLGTVEKQLRKEREKWENQTKG